MDRLMLVNRQNVLPRDYVPKELVQDSITKIWLKKEPYRLLGGMNKEIQKAGLSKLIFVSGYRSYSYQEELFNKKVHGLVEAGLCYEEAVKKASSIVALPGTSEHQTGLAIDITNAQLSKEKDPLVEGFAQTDHGKWLDINASNFGFILRYPKDKVGITSIVYEPWHYRYVGVKHAKVMNSLKVCLEEYVSYMDKNKL